MGKKIKREKTRKKAQWRGPGEKRVGKRTKGEKIAANFIAVGKDVQNTTRKGTTR